VEDSRSLVTGAALRFGAGIAGAALVGWLVFRERILRPDGPAFEFFTVGALLAGILALIRQSRRGQALVLALAFAGIRFAVSPVVPLGAAFHGMLLGLGLFIVALIFDLLALRGWRLGKFLLVGPLVGGVFLALAPIGEIEHMNVFNASDVLIFRLALGMLIGEGVALGVELVELPLGWKRHNPAG
jgi:hypothetical protein